MRPFTLAVLLLSAAVVITLIVVLTWAYNPTILVLIRGIVTSVTTTPVPSASLPPVELNPTLTDARYLFIPHYSMNPNTMSVVDTAQTPPMVLSTTIGLGTNDDASIAVTNRALSRLYVINYSGSISVLDISNIGSIQLLKVITVSSTTQPEMVYPDGACLSADESLLYVACNGTFSSETGSGGIAVVEVSTNTITNFITDAQLNGPDSVWLDVSGRFLFVSNANDAPTSVAVYDTVSQAVTDDFLLTTGLGTTQWLEKFVVNHENTWLFGMPYAVTGGVPSPFYAVDIQNASVYHIDTVYFYINQVVLSVDEQTVFACSYDDTNGSHLLVFDVSTPSNPSLAAHVALPSGAQAYGLQVDKTYVYVTDSNAPHLYLCSAATPYALQTTLTLGDNSYYPSQLINVQE